MLCRRCGGELDAQHRFCPRCAEPISRPQADPLLDQVIGDDYRIRRLLGVGGMGRVYEAEQIALGRSVAVKVIHPQHVGDETAAARFHAEARAASRLNHPNSVAVLDFGRTKSGQHYLVMEYLRGRDLACLLAEEGPLPPLRAAEIARQVCEALAAAHELGIVHRDVKPDNILIQPLRHGVDLVKVLDFGLATTTSRTARITSAGIICGTPEYMSPEQGSGEPLDGRSDLYSLGVVLYEALTGVLPFEGEGIRLLSSHLTEPPVPPSWRVPQRRLPSALEEITLRALAKRPEDRYASADDMAAALEELLTTERLGEAGRVCIGCGHVSPVSSRYCAVCGARHSTGTKHVSAEVEAAAYDLPQSLADERILGRDDALAQMLRVRRDADRRGASALVVGEPGVGVRTFARELERHARARGDLVAWAGPEATGAAVPHRAARTLLAALLGVDAEISEGEVREVAANFGLDADAQVGVGEAFSIEGAAELDPSTRPRAVGLALRATVERACRSRRVLAVVERLDRCDPTSRAAFAMLARPPMPAGFLLVGLHGPGFDANWSWAQRVDLVGLAAAQAWLLFARRGNGAMPSIEIPKEVLATDAIGPLYVEEVVRFVLEGGTTVPSSLADLVVARIDLLPPEARRLLHAAAILGESTTRADLEWMLDGAELDGTLAVLVERGLLVEEDRRVRFAHPFYVDVIATGIPASVRSALHRRAVDLRARCASPLAVRAYHAMHAEGGFLALLQLDLAGEEACRRGDPASAIVYFRRGIEIARRALSGSDLADPVRANLLFYRKLARALVAAGDRSLAVAILREGLALCLGGHAERAELLESIEQIVGGRRDAASTQSIPEMHLAVTLEAAPAKASPN